MVWEDDPTLFLYKKGYPSNMIYTARCQNISKAVPLGENDFDTEFPYSLGGFRRLLRSSTTWTRDDFEKLIDYISNNHYRVNCQGVVILKVFPFDENVNLANSVPIYVRLLDVIDLTNFGFRPRPSKVPPMKPQYFVDSGDALVEDPPVFIPPVIPPVTILPFIIKPRPIFDPSWMTYNWENDWVDINGLELIHSISDGAPKVEYTKAGFQFVDDNTTNVQKDYFYGIKFTTTRGNTMNLEYMVVAGLGDRITQARFNPNIWGLFGYNGITYPTRDFF